jgi:hypothetical protein
MCAVCMQPVIYWDGGFRHLSYHCPGDAPVQQEASQ